MMQSCDFSLVYCTGSLQHKNIWSPIAFYSIDFFTPQDTFSLPNVDILHYAIVDHRLASF